MLDYFLEFTLIELIITWLYLIIVVDQLLGSKILSVVFHVEVDVLVESFLFRSDGDYFVHDTCRYNQ